MQSCSFLHDSEFAMPNLQMIQETQRRKSTDKSDKELVVCCLGHGSPALLEMAFKYLATVVTPCMKNLHRVSCVLTDFSCNFIMLLLLRHHVGSVEHTQGSQK